MGRGGTRPYHIDAGKKSISSGLDQLLVEMPSTGPAAPTDLARIIIEDRIGFNYSEAAI